MERQFSATDFLRQDESNDANFYTAPRLVVHIDEQAIAAVTDILRRYLPANGRVLDLMSSYRSHLPADGVYQEVVGLGMNAVEMQANPQLDRFVLQNLNKQPVLPFPDAHFDAVINTVSVQYLIRPVDVFLETARVLKPGGISIVTFSNRMFPTKAVQIWAKGTDAEHILLVKHYFEQAGGFEPAVIERHVDTEHSRWQARHDPLFAVIATRSKNLS